MQNIKITNYQQSKLIHAALYILQKTGCINCHKLFAILYLAESKHLAKWGDAITSDSYLALEYGPVPTLLHSIIKQNGYDEFFKQNLNTNYLSKSNIEMLDASINESKSLTPEQLKTKSCNLAWLEAYSHQNDSNVISKISMAKALGADDTMLEYIKEQIELNQILT